jgi:hypothetical protein
MKKWSYGVAAAGLLAAMALGQTPVGTRSDRSLTQTGPAAEKGSVEFLFPEQVTVPANKASTVTLHFRVAPGMHINSHSPKDAFLIPTVFTLPEGGGVQLEAVTYPAGAEFALPLEPKNKLSVYTGEFVLLARIVAAPGDHLVEAKLRYQACDNNACMPPRTLIVAMDVVGTGNEGTRE